MSGDDAAVGDVGRDVHRQRGDDEIGAGAGDAACRASTQRGEDLRRGGARRLRLAAVGGEERAVELAAAGGDDGEHRPRAARRARFLGVDGERADADGRLAGDQREAAGGGDADAHAGERARPDGDGDAVEIGEGERLPPSPPRSCPSGARRGRGRRSRSA